MQLNPSEISDLIKSRIQNLQLAATSRNEGTVVSVTGVILKNNSNDTFGGAHTDQRSLTA
jgi:F0F1-type ATP synthase alpha subunit